MVGDVYYCKTKFFQSINNEGQRQFTSNKFSFKWGEKKIIFDKKGWFKGLDFDINQTGWDNFQASTRYATIYYVKGNFYYGSATLVGVYSLVAECDVF